MAPANKMKTKSRPPKMTTQTLLDFDLGESSSDSDFRIEDHDESDDDFSESENSNAKDSGGDDEDDDESDSEEDSESAGSELKYLLGSPKASKDTKNLKEILNQAAASSIKDKLPTHPICCACLGDRSDDTNEIVECDGCGVSVHEGCYGVSDSTSVSSTISSCSTEPWFCEACKASVTNPSCELCPNKGGIFKETDVGKWVHLVCALYVPGVAFGEVDQLSSVTLFEMPYSKWGAKTCTLCEDARFARTGVCIGCDAGMCKTYFHVTCAQAAGFLSEAHSEEADHADPFYAHCKIHSDKSMIKHRKRNYNTLKLRMEQRKLTKIENQNEKPTPEQIRITRKLNKHQAKYRTTKGSKMEPWVPTQKMPRLLTTSATACRRLMLKAELMGINTEALEFQDVQMAALADVRRKWHIPPAFSVEFIGYYLDRISRLKELKTNLSQQIETNKKLLSEQQSLRDEYDEKIKVNAELNSNNTKLKEAVSQLHVQIEALCPNKTLPLIDNIGRPVIAPASVPSPRPMSVPTAAALKMGVGFPLTNLPGKKDDSGRILSTQRQNNELVHECGICKRCNDQHLLAKCDTCHFYYHLGCLNPPLTRHPKKSKLYGWQCSECDKSDDSDVVVDLPKGPRKSRTRFSKDGTIVPVDPNLSNAESTTSSKTENSPAKRKSIDKPLLKKERNSDLGESTNQEKPVQNNLSNSKTSPIPSKNKKLKTVSSPKKTAPSTVQNNIIDNKEDPLKEESKLNEPKTEDSIADESASESVSSKSKVKALKKLKKEKKFPTTNDEKEETTPALEAPISEESKSEITNEKSSVTMSIDLQPPNNIIVENDIAKSVDQLHKQNRKRRKEKHKNKYSSDHEKSPSKEHKRKRKKKSHDRENPNDSVPKIKIKFKTLPLPGEAAPEAQFFYVPADMVRPQDTSRPTSVETVDDSTMNADDVIQNLSNEDKKTPANTSTPISRISSPIKTDHLSNSTPRIREKKAKIQREASPRKLSKKESTNTNASVSINDKNNILDIICDVCSEIGTNQNLVKCDECAKNYHFTCLDPPLKKTPKRRGYSWHCADCDPTDNEST